MNKSKLEGKFRPVDEICFRVVSRQVRAHAFVLLLRFSRGFFHRS
jgi:hypothetical protein